MRVSSIVEIGLSGGQSGRFRTWGDAGIGLAASAFGDAATSYADVFFARLSRLSDEGVIDTSLPYPPRVVAIARVLESLHRELWQSQKEGRNNFTLGAGVLSVEDDRTFFLQVGPAHLSKLTASDAKIITEPTTSGPLLGSQAKSGIRVHNVRIAPGDRLVLLSGDLATRVDPGVLPHLFSGEIDAQKASGVVLSQLEGTDWNGAVITMRFPDLVGLSAVKPAAVAASVAPASALFHDPPPPSFGLATSEAEAAPPVSTPFDFHTEVLRELSDFMSTIKETRREEPSAEPPISLMEPMQIENGSPLLAERAAAQASAVADPPSPTAPAEPAFLPSGASAAQPAGARKTIAGSHSPNSAELKDALRQLDQLLDETGAAPVSAHEPAVVVPRSPAMPAAPPPPAVDALPSAPGVAGRAPVGDSFETSSALADPDIDFSDVSMSLNLRDLKLSPDALAVLNTGTSVSAVHDIEAEVALVADEEAHGTTSAPVAAPESSDTPTMRLSSIEGETASESVVQAPERAIAPEGEEEDLSGGKFAWLRRPIVFVGFFVLALLVVLAWLFRGEILKSDEAGEPTSQVLPVSETPAPETPPDRARDTQPAVVPAEPPIESAAPPATTESGTVRASAVASTASEGLTLPAAAGSSLVLVHSRRFAGDHFEDSVGDSVYVDRAFVGVTPIQHPLEPGVHSVRVGADPASAITQIVEVPADAARVVRADFGFDDRLALTALPASVPDPSAPLRVVVREEERGPRAERVTCFYRLGSTGPFVPQELEKDPAERLWSGDLPGTAGARTAVEYYFQALDADEAEIVSELQRGPRTARTR